MEQARISHIKQLEESVHSTLHPSMAESIIRSPVFQTEKAYERSCQSLETLRRKAKVF